MTGSQDGWAAAATIIQAVATIVALGGVALTFVLQRRGLNQVRDLAREDADRAEKADRAAEAKAERAEAAAALTIDQMSRMAEALEALASHLHIASSGRDGGTIDPLPVRWQLTHFGGDTYKLENIGAAVAHRVEVSSHPTLFSGNFTGGPDVGIGEAITFMAAVTFGTQDSTITVTWSSNDALATPRQIWRYPLPPKS
jgi:hypothetical protein